MDHPFALAWTLTLTVFVHLRDVHGHDFYMTEEEMYQVGEQLKTQSKVGRITYYERKDGELVVIDEWDRTLY